MIGKASTEDGALIPIPVRPVTTITVLSKNRGTDRNPVRKDFLGGSAREEGMRHEITTGLGWAMVMCGKPHTRVDDSPFSIR